MSGGDLGGTDAGGTETPCGDDTICEDCDTGCDTVDTSTDTGGSADAFTGD